MPNVKLGRDYSRECVRCDADHVVTIDGKRGRICPACMWIAIEDTAAMAEAEKILTTGKLTEDGDGK